MAIAFDQTTTDQQPAGSSLSFSASTSGAKRLLLVPIFTSYGSTGDKISSVTYNGVTMTRVSGATQIDFVSGQSFYLYYLIAPATGSNTVLVTGVGSGEIYATAVSYTGVDQTTPIDNSTTTTSGGTITLTTVANNCWLLSFGRNTSSGPLTASTGTTQRSAGSGIYNIGDSNGPITPAGSASMSWTPNNASTKLCLVSFAPALGTDYSVIAAVGSFALSGIAVNLITALRMVAVVGSFALTGINVGFMTGKGMIAGVGSFIMTGMNALLRFSGWSNQSKDQTSYGNQSKNNATWTDQNKSL